ncbi:unnamed protein product, partial [Meganyctiphanes norvegica]
QSSGSLGGIMSSVNGSASKSSTPKSQSSIDLLADLSHGSATAPVAANTTDPFASPTTTAVPATAGAASSQESFANFENANIFTNTNLCLVPHQVAVPLDPLTPSNFGGFMNGGNNVFGTPPTSNTGGSFFPQQAPQNTAPTASQPWTANFSGPNPFCR